MTRSAGTVAALAQAQPLSSARAKGSATLGSFPEASMVSRFSMQAMAARRAGNPLPWQD
jgi:hypothetical protein